MNGILKYETIISYYIIYHIDKGIREVEVTKEEFVKSSFPLLKDVPVIYKGKYNHQWYNVISEYSGEVVINYMDRTAMIIRKDIFDELDYTDVNIKKLGELWK